MAFNYRTAEVALGQHSIYFSVSDTGISLEFLLSSRLQRNVNHPKVDLHEEGCEVESRC